MSKQEIDLAVDQVLDEQEADAIDFGNEPLKSLKPVGEPTPVDWAIRHCEIKDEEETRFWDSYERQGSEEWRSNYSPPLSKEDIDHFERLVTTGGYGIDCEAVIALLSPYMSNIETHTTDIKRWYSWLHGDEDPEDYAEVVEQAFDQIDFGEHPDFGDAIGEMMPDFHFYWTSDPVKEHGIVFSVAWALSMDEELREDYVTWIRRPHFQEEIPASLVERFYEWVGGEFDHEQELEQSLVLLGQVLSRDLPLRMKFINAVEEERERYRAEREAELESVEDQVDYGSVPDREGEFEVDVGVDGQNYADSPSSFTLAGEGDHGCFISGRKGVEAARVELEKEEHPVGSWAEVIDEYHGAAFAVLHKTVDGVDIEYVHAEPEMEESLFSFAPSSIHGSGVIAQQPIGVGEELGVTHQQREDGSWEMLPLGNYNHSSSPTAAIVQEPGQKSMIVLQDLVPGDELSVDYTQQLDLEQPQADWR